MSEKPKTLDWRDRFRQFEEVLNKLEHLASQRTPSIGLLMKDFEDTYELGWKTVRDYLATKGIKLRKSTTTIKRGVREGLLEHRQAWDKLRKDRNIAIHSYGGNELYEEIAERVMQTHLHTFQQLRRRFSELADGQPPPVS